MNGAEPSFTLTIQDIVTVANIAYENNKKYGLDDPDDYNYYVAVHVDGKRNLEKKINDNGSNNTFYATSLLKASNKKTYKCVARDVNGIEGVKINPNTGRVCELNFKEINN